MLVKRTNLISIYIICTLRKFSKTNLTSNESLIYMGNFTKKIVYHYKNLPSHIHVGILPTHINFFNMCRYYFTMSFIQHHLLLIFNLVTNNICETTYVK